MRGRARVPAVQGYVHRPGRSCLDLPGDRADVPQRRPGPRRAGTSFLRHNAASRLLAAGVPLPTISAVLGHASGESTSTHLSLDEDRLAQCVLPVPARGTIMTGDHGFTSAFAAQLVQYLSFKEAMGFHGTSRVWYLKKFDAWCTEHDRATFDRDTVEGWVSDRLTGCGAYRSWMSYIRDFGRWLHAHGHTDAYVLSQEWKAPFVPSHPYLLSTAEIEAFFAAAAHVRASSPWAWQAVAFFHADALPRDQDREGPRPAGR